MSATTVAEAPGRVAGAPRPETDRARAERKLGWMLCAPAVIVMLAVTAYLYVRPAPTPSAEPVKLQIAVPSDVNTGGRNFALSPDGRKLAFFAVGCFSFV